MEEEFEVVCVCGLTTYSLHTVTDPEKKDVPKRIVARCVQCGRIRFIFHQVGRNGWALYDRVPFG